MASRSSAFLAVLLAVSVAVAGCLKKPDDPGTDLSPGGAVNETPPNATLPDDRGTAIAFEETNKTEEGVGGVEHKHDYWKGREQVVVYQATRYFSQLPIYPDGEGTEPKGVAYIKLPQPELIYEGASTVEVLVSAVEFETVTGGPMVPHPAPPTLTLTYRTAADDDFREGPALTLGTPAVIPVSAKETDMPHSVSSLWAFRIATDRPDLASANVTITAKRGGAVVDWPGHPDFYADTTQRVIVDKDFKVHRQGIEEGMLYGGASSWVAPDKLISYGTGRLDIFINITKATASNGATPTGFFLEYHNATILHAEDDYNDRIDDEHGGRAFTDAEYHFTLDVDPAGMDGPYQPSSRWGFRPVATFAETPAASLCPGCFAYDIEYHMTVVAHKADSEQARLNE